MNSRHPGQKEDLCDLESSSSSTPWFSVHELALIALYQQMHKFPSDKLDITDQETDLETLHLHALANKPCIVKNINTPYSKFSPIPQHLQNINEFSPPSWPTQWGRVEGGGAGDIKPYPNYFNNPYALPIDPPSHLGLRCQPNTNIPPQPATTLPLPQTSTTYKTLNHIYGEELQRRLDHTRVNFDHFSQYYGDSKVTISNCAIRDSNSQQCQDSTLQEYLDEWREHVSNTQGIMMKCGKDNDANLQKDGQEEKSNSFNDTSPSQPFLKYCRDWHLAVDHYDAYKKGREWDHKGENEQKEQDQEGENGGDTTDQNQPRLQSTHDQSFPPQFYSPPLCVSNDGINLYWDYLVLAQDCLERRQLRRQSDELQPDQSPEHHLKHDKRSLMIDDYRFVYFGPHSSFTPCHRDVYASYSYSGNIVGVKLWIMLPPSYVKLTQTDPISSTVDLFDIFNQKLVQRCSDLNQELFPTHHDLNQHSLYQSLEEWIIDLRQSIDSSLSSPTPSSPSVHSSCPDLKPIILLQFPGDLVFVPSFWAHQVVNLTDCISINHNWGNSYNYGKIVSQLLLDNISIKAGLDEYKMSNEQLDWWVKEVEGQVDEENCVGGQSSKIDVVTGVGTAFSLADVGEGIDAIAPFSFKAKSGLAYTPSLLKLSSHQSTVARLLSQLNQSSHGIPFNDRILKQFPIEKYYVQPSNSLNDGIDKSLPQKSVMTAHKETNIRTNSKPVSILHTYQHLLRIETPIHHNDGDHFHMYTINPNLWNPSDGGANGCAFNTNDDLDSESIVSIVTDSPILGTPPIQLINTIIDYYEQAGQYVIDTNVKIDQYNSKQRVESQKRQLEFRKQQYQLQQEQLSLRNDNPSQAQTTSPNQIQATSLKLMAPQFKPLSHLTPPPNIFDTLVTEQRLLNTNCGMNLSSFYQLLTVNTLSSISSFTLLIEAFGGLLPFVYSRDKSTKGFAKSQSSQRLQSDIKSIVSRLTTSDITNNDATATIHTHSSNTLTTLDTIDIFRQLHHLTPQSSLNFVNPHHFSPFQPTAYYGLLTFLSEVKQFSNTITIDKSSNQLTNEMINILAVLFNRIFHYLSHILFGLIETTKCLYRLYQDTDFSLISRITIALRQFEMSKVESELTQEGHQLSLLQLISSSSPADIHTEGDNHDYSIGKDVKESIINLYHLLCPRQQNDNLDKNQHLNTTNLVPFLDLRLYISSFTSLVHPFLVQLTNSTGDTFNNPASDHCCNTQDNVDNIMICLNMLNELAKVSRY